MVIASPLVNLLLLARYAHVHKLTYTLKIGLSITETRAWAAIVRSADLCFLRGGFPGFVPTESLLGR